MNHSSYRQAQVLQEQLSSVLPPLAIHPAQCTGGQSKSFSEFFGSHGDVADCVEPTRTELAHLRVPLADGKIAP
jgi:hypothetical protein